MTSSTKSLNNVVRKEKTKTTGITEMWKAGSLEKLICSVITTHSTGFMVSRRQSGVSDLKYRTFLK